MTERREMHRLETQRPAPLSPADQETLRTIVRHMIPPSEDFGTPGADDPAIFADIVRSVQRDRAALGQALRAVDAASGGRLVALRETEQATVLARFRADEPALAAILEAVTVRCYYRDERVLKSIGMEPRPPFPRGYEIEEGDWSLLDPVRARGPVYRDAG
jgi:hypothetical protein